MSGSTKINYKELIFLDGIRGLAAFYVMVGHARWLLWEGYSSGYLDHPEDYSLVGKILVYGFSTFRYGHEAVLLFFVLSGFVIHLKYAFRLKNPAETNNGFSVLDFYKRRARRLYPPLVTALILTFLLDKTGEYLGLNIYNGDTVYPLINVSIQSDHAITTLVGNLGFLMTFYFPVFGSNGPLWSLAYEGWFYIFYPLFFLLINRSISLATVVMIALFVVANFIGFPLLLLNKVFGLMLCWWLGVLLAEIYVGRVRLNFGWLIPLLLLLPVLVAELLPDMARNIHDFLWSLCFTGMFGLFFFLKRRGISLAALEKLKILGDFSYTLYVVHLPVLILMSGLIMRADPEGQLPLHFGYVFLGIAISLVLSYFLYHKIEKPFTTKRV